VPYVPARQNWQAVTVTAPRVVEYVPAPHRVQLALAGMPSPVWNVPATQDWHTDTAGPPSTVEYVPAAHAEHVPARTAPRKVE
jgi:hypothetical protein